MKEDMKDIFQGGKKLPLVEEFYTLQGEGRNMGQAAYFIRIGGCDVGCHWCDSKLSWNAKDYPIVLTDQIIQNAVKYPAKTIVVTGGEPLLYPLDYLTDNMKALGIRTMLETSGSHHLTGTWDWICLSPKRNLHPLPENLAKAHELKVVVEDKQDLIWAEENAAKVSENCFLYLQPEWSVSNNIMTWLTEYIMQHPKWRISLQSHKYMRLP
jgi:Organic radical activating enzymes